MDLVQLSQCRSIEDVIRGLKGSAYYEPLEKLLEQGKATLPACETAMDMLYFKTIWKIKDKYLSKAEAKMTGPVLWYENGYAEFSVDMPGQKIL